MKYSVHFAATVLAANSFSHVLAQTWCGKNYMANQTVVPPGGQFQLPGTSTEPLLAFRCSPAFRPYLEEDATNATFIIDTPIVYRYIESASLISLSSSDSNSSDNDLGTVVVTISIGDQVFAQEDVPLDATRHEISLDISSLVAQKTPHNVTCNAAYQTQTSTSSAQQFSANTSLLYLPDTNTSVVKTDLRTGALWVRPADEEGGDFEPFIPQGFYVSFEEYLAHNLSLIDELKEQGFNTIHPIPPYDNVTLFQQVLNRSIELGLYFVVDMRSDYQNLTTVARLVDEFSSLPNLLHWETAHEPDGNSDPLNATRNAYDLIYQIDGYHPVSIVLTCQDYNFAPYVEGADIVVEDVYPIGINATYSVVWNTSCTPDFGHCGCDNCKGNIYDIKARVQTYKDRLNILGYDRSKTVWATPQAFGSEIYWNTTPTGQQWVAMGVTSFSHGVRGSISYQYPTTSGNATTIEGIAPDMTSIVAEIIQPFVVNPDTTYETFNVGGVDAGLWNNGTTYLLLAANLNQSDVSVFVPWSRVGLGNVTQVTNATIDQIFSVSQNTNSTGMLFSPGGIGIYMATNPFPK